MTNYHIVVALFFSVAAVGSLAVIAWEFSHKWHKIRAIALGYFNH